jgi:hypothetical protein
MAYAQQEVSRGPLRAMRPYSRRVLYLFKKIPFI